MSLPGPRGAALRRLVTDARAVVTGRGPRPKVVKGEPVIPRRTAARLRTALAEGDRATATRTAEAIVRDHPDHVLALETMLADRLATGELTAARALMVRIRAVMPARPSASAAAEAPIVTSLVTSDPRWLPRLPGPPRTIASDPTAAALELSDTTLLEGLDGGVPLDEALTAATWRADRHARSSAVSVIHVTPDAGAIGALQVGLALHRHTGLPLRAEPWRDDPTIPPTSELARRRRVVAEAISAAAGDGADPSGATPTDT
jgi:hypothetical protein